MAASYTYQEYVVSMVTFCLPKLRVAMLFVFYEQALGEQSPPKPANDRSIPQI
jgi:hypothetical protein